MSEDCPGANLQDGRTEARIMEDFNELLVKLQEVHDREMEGWQVKVQELSNKKGCDSKRMEELYTRNQQMKEQQRILTENIKTLENRLRAGLCDRCTVTQEVAKKRQQEFETLHLQSMQHITVMVSDINNLKRENKQLRDEVRSLRAALDSQAERSSPAVSSAEVKNSSSNILPMALINRALSRSTQPPEGALSCSTQPPEGALSRSTQPPEGDVTVKVETAHRTHESRNESRHLREWNKVLFDSYKPLPNSLPPSWKQPPRTVDRRSHEDHPSPSSPPVKPLPSSLSPPSRHILHAPVPCRPQPLRSTPGSLSPWLALGEPPDWATATAASSSSSQSSRPRFPNLIPSHQHVNAQSAVRRLALGPAWHRPSTAAVSSSTSSSSSTTSAAREPTVVLRLKSAEQQERVSRAQETTQERKEEGNNRQTNECDGPLDLSDSGRVKPAPRDSSPAGGAAQSGQGQKENGENEGEDSAAAAGPSSPEAPTETEAGKPEESSEHSHKLLIKQRKHQEVNGKADNGKKVPVLTISLRPVVVLESLKSSIQKQGSTSSNQNSPQAEGASSAEEKEEGPWSKRKRESSDSERDTDTDCGQRERKVLISVRSEEKS